MDKQWSENWKTSKEVFKFLRACFVDLFAHGVENTSCYIEQSWTGTSSPRQLKNTFKANVDHLISCLLCMFWMQAPLSPKALRTRLSCMLVDFENRRSLQNKFHGMACLHWCQIYIGDIFVLMEVWWWLLAILIVVTTDVLHGA